MTRLVPLTLLAAVAVPGIPSTGVSQDDQPDLAWHDAARLVVEGQAWSAESAPFTRLPHRAEGVVRDPVWRLSRDSAGIAIRFRTDSPRIRARWTLRSSQLAMPHMTATGASGLDLYVRTEDAGQSWRWLGVGMPEKFPDNEAGLVRGLPEGEREYLLYLPLYNGVSLLELGVDEGRRILAAPARSPAARRPLVFYGTSITQGACASRPGMCHAAILGRRLDRPVVNLGFSGNGTLDLSMAELLGEIDAELYVVDCLPNLRAPQIQRAAGAVRASGCARCALDAPIVLVEDRSYANAFLLEPKRAAQRGQQARQALYEGYHATAGKRCASPSSPMFPGSGLLGEDGDATVDSSHPTDLGFLRQADVLQPRIEAALTSRVLRDGARPNLVLLMVDDMGWGDLGCYGSEFHETPHIDRLAAEGVRFTDAYASSPVCSPSRASVMTGKSPARIRITDWIPGRRYPKAKLRVPEFAQEVRLEETTLAEALSAHGYSTWHVGKWHLGGEGFYPLDQGFDVNIGGHSKGAPGSYFFPYEKKTPQTDWSVRNLPPGGAEGEYLTDRLTDEALALLDTRGDGPFFLHMSYYTVHSPYEGKPELVEKYRAKKQARPAFADEHAVYAAMVESLDHSVGRILDRLEALGIAKETVVLLTSDNGGVIGVADNGGLREGKGFLYEGGIRVPLIVRWPGVAPAGARCARPVVGEDVFATLVDLGQSVAGSVRTQSQDGRSFRDAILRPERAGTRELYWHYPHYHTPKRPPSGAVRSGVWKYLRFYEDGREELYRLPDDPGETTDLAADWPDVVTTLRGRFDQWLAASAAQMAAPNPDYDPEQPFAAGYTAWRD